LPLTAKHYDKRKYCTNYGAGGGCGDMTPYQTKARKLPGTSYSEVKKEATTLFSQVKKRSKRSPYIRSAYFKKEKIFLNYFWSHLLGKSMRDRTRRLKFLPCALDLISNSRITPTSKENADNRNEILHRFTGQTKDKEIFFVQIKEDKRNSKKYFISCFPSK
jgi:hypothetical protein